jgi:hypothetical protein
MTPAAAPRTPVSEQLGSADSYGRYRASATLFVHELLREDRGRKAIREFIRDTHRSLNWQTTFLAVSAGQFRSLLDVEKWWAVASVEVVGRGPSQFWPADRVIAELAVIMTETADLPATNRTGTVRRTLPLREVIQTWDFPAQRPSKKFEQSARQLPEKNFPFVGMATKEGRLA